MTGTVGHEEEQDTGNNRFADTENDYRGKSVHQRRFYRCSQPTRHQNQHVVQATVFNVNGTCRIRRLKKASAHEGSPDLEARTLVNDYCY